MRNTIRRFLAMVMAVMMALTAVPLYALSDEIDLSEDEVYGYLYEDGSYVIKSGTREYDGVEAGKYDLSSSSTNGINGNDKIKRIVVLDEFTPTDCTNYFANAVNLTDVSGLSLMRTSSITSFEGMFSGDSSLTYVDMTSIDAGSLTNTCRMFYNCSSLLTVSFDYLGRVENADMMFYGCTAMSNQDTSFLPSTASKTGIFDSTGISLDDGQIELDPNGISSTDTLGINNDGVQGVVESNPDDFNQTIEIINNVDENQIENTEILTNTEENKNDINEEGENDNKENNNEEVLNNITDESENQEENNEDEESKNSSPEMQEISIFSEWIDNDVSIRPIMASYKIYANGEVSDIITLTMEDIYNNTQNIWCKTITLPKYDINSNEIVYTVEQDAFDRYDTVGGAVENGCAYFTNTAKAPAKKKALLGTPSHGDYAGDETTLKQTAIRATIDIEWWDGWYYGEDNRPTSVNVRAYELPAGTEVDAVDLSSYPFTDISLTSDNCEDNYYNYEDNYHWRKTVDLPKADTNGNDIWYYFVQETPEGYISSDELSKIYALSFDENPNYGNDTEVSGYFTNCQAVEHTVDVVWKDNHNSKQCRPNELDVESCGYNDTRSEDDAIFDYSFTKTISANDVTEDTDTWRTTVKLPAYGIPGLYNAAENYSAKLHFYSCGENLYSYYLTHPDTIYGFTVNTEDNYTRILAEAVPETTEFFVSVIWDDDNDSRGDRPQTITLQLLANGEPYDDAVDVTNENRVYDDEYGWDYHFPFPTGYEETVTDNEWRYLFTYLPKFDDNGNEISYTVEMENGTLADYEQTYADMYDDSDTPVFKGQYIISKYNEAIHDPKIHIQGKKTWDDNNDEKGIRPDKITVILKEAERHLEKNDDDEWVWSDYSEPTEIARKVVTADDDWEYDFGEYISVDKGGNDIHFTIEEEPVRGYVAVYDGFNITNSYEEPTTKNIIVNKVWNDADNKDNTRPSEVEITLYANGEAVETKTAYADDWTCTFENVPIKDEDGNIIEYSVKDEDIMGYLESMPRKRYKFTEAYLDRTENGNDYWVVENTAVREFGVGKIWRDGDNEADERPEKAPIYLYRKINDKEIRVEEEPVVTKSDRDPNMEQYVFYDLLKYDAEGNEIIYYPGEEDIPGYRKVIRYNEDNNSEIAVQDYFEEANAYIINIHPVKAGKKTKFAVGKEWDGDTEDVRPDSITIHIYDADTREELCKFQMTDADVSTDDNGNPKHNYWYAETPEFEAYAVDEDGYIITDENGHYQYRNMVVEEDPVPGYTSSSSNGFVKGNWLITNTYEGIVTISVTKIWDDDKDIDKIRPENAPIHLYKETEEGRELLEVEPELVEKDDTTYLYTFTNLPKKDADGNLVKYVVDEDDVDGYEKKVEKNSDTEYTITNTHKQTIEIKGTKTWDDENDKDGLRPEKVKIYLYANEKEIDSVEINADGEWKFDFGKLPKFDENDQEIKYELMEEAVEGYEPTFEGWNITNTHVPAEDAVSVKGRKVWDDVNNKLGLRPNSIIVRLYADGKEVDYKKVTEKDNWAYVFTDLPKQKDGKDIVYTVSEDAVEGYTTTINGYIIINTLHVEKADSADKDIFAIEGTKTWDDNNNQDGIRPSFITVRLYADGKEVANTKATAANNWKFTFTNLPRSNNGQIINYTIDEDSVPGYTKSINGYNITNTHKINVQQTTNTSSVSQQKDNVVNTGDRQNALPYIILIVLAGLLVGLTAFVKKSKKG